jgi:hypothetical protein
MTTKKSPEKKKAKVVPAWQLADDPNWRPKCGHEGCVLLATADLAVRAANVADGRKVYGISLFVDLAEANFDRVLAGCEKAIVRGLVTKTHVDQLMGWDDDTSLLGV